MRVSSSTADNSTSGSGLLGRLLPDPGVEGGPPRDGGGISSDDSIGRDPPSDGESPWEARPDMLVEGAKKDEEAGSLAVTGRRRTVRLGPRGIS